MNKKLLIISSITILVLVAVYYLLETRKANTPLGCLKHDYQLCYETFMINKASISPKLDCIEIVTDNCENPDITLYNYCPNKVTVEGKVIELPSESCTFGRTKYYKTHKGGKYVITKATYGENYNKNDTKEEIIFGDTVDVDIKIGMNIYKYTLFANTKDWIQNLDKKIIGDCLNIEKHGWNLKFISKCNDPVYIDGWELGAYQSSTPESMDACNLIYSWIELDEVYSAPVETLKKEKKLMYDGKEYIINYTITESMCTSSKDSNY